MSKIIHKTTDSKNPKNGNKSGGLSSKQPLQKRQTVTPQRPVTRKNVPHSTESHVVKKSIDIKGLPSEVWDALTNPAKTKKYFFNCEVHSDWKPGSPITFKGRMFWIIPIEMKGEIIKVEKDKLLKYSLHNKAKGSNEATTSTVTDSMTYHNGITTLSVSDDVGNGEGAQERYDKSVKGWDKVLHGLKKLVESGK
ncbi:MAG: hypothetical protein HOP08_15140 [Cyclobacteriaceae bacterium]|nr:hypothetical protein [Cyclobacteriaceae bacterium]